VLSSCLHFIRRAMQLERCVKRGFGSSLTRIVPISLDEMRPTRAATTSWCVLDFVWRSLGLAKEACDEHRESHAKRSHTTKWSPAAQAPRPGGHASAKDLHEPQQILPFPMAFVAVCSQGLAAYSWRHDADDSAGLGIEGQ
jgi:hypothetical protein